MAIRNPKLGAPRRLDERSWMWAEACELLEHAQRLQRQFFGLGQAVAAQPCWEPPVDIVSYETEVRITVALPGVPADRLRVQVEGDRVMVRALRVSPLDDRTVAVHRLEIPYGTFQRTLLLPSGGYQLLEQVFRDGCLLLRLGKR